jgi:glycerol-3-phosphate acyltransferase PlsY
VNTFFTCLALLPYYLLGAFPTGRLVARLHGVDITAVGSGNVGATNVSRVVGKRAGIITLLCDIAKGAVAIGIAKLCSPDIWFAASVGVAVVAGHCFSIPTKLKGGKGVATALGVLLMLSPIAALIAIATFALVFSVSRIVSISSIVSALVVPTASLVSHSPDSIVMAQALLAAIVIYRHRENIVRLIEGREPQFAFKK